MSDRKLKILILMAALSAGILLISNLAAVKLWNLFGIAVDGGFICFPLTYIVSDLVIELFGKKNAGRIIWSSFLVNLIAVAVFWIVIALPTYDGWEGQGAFAAILGFTPRIIFGSLIAYISSNFLNNRVFVKIKNSKNPKIAKSYIARALGSSVVAHAIDSAIFETIAFLGVLPFSEFVAQALFAYVLGLGAECLLSPIELIIVKKFKKYLHE